MNIPIYKKKYTPVLPTNLPRRDRYSPKKNPNYQTMFRSTWNTNDFCYSPEVKLDPSTILPIRRTSFVFDKQLNYYGPKSNQVTYIKHQNQEQSRQGKTKEDKNKYPDKPRQLFWEKRLAGMRACDYDGREFARVELPKLRPIGLCSTEESLMQSVATAFHWVRPVTGQTGSQFLLEENFGIYVNPDQPLIQPVSISNEEIKLQEERVAIARKRLQNALNSM